MTLAMGAAVSSSGQVKVHGRYVVIRLVRDYQDRSAGSFEDQS